MRVIDHRYGKARVRLMKVLRKEAWHELKELSINVLLSGAFEPSFEQGDNRLVVATDSMKNTINVLAFQELCSETEPFLRLVAEHFLQKYSQVQRVELESREHLWERLIFAQSPHPHSFKSSGSHRLVARLVQTREECRLESGVEDLLILKSTGSGFENFLRDEFTTLPEVKDRIFATRMNALWSWSGLPREGYVVANGSILQAMLQEFATSYSISVQASLYNMARAALQLAPEISKVHIAMPNNHCNKISLEPFGIEANPNILFAPTDEPHGQIEATIER